MNGTVKLNDPTTNFIVFSTLIYELIKTSYEREYTVVYFMRIMIEYIHHSMEI